MVALPTQKNNGFALLVFLIVLMGLGGILLTGYSKKIAAEVEEKKFQNNVMVLRQAKDALLQFAYNYPVKANGGPGRLPCADTDNDGQPNPAVGDCTSIGRFPWADTDLGTEELLDSDGGRLWYAVSATFATDVPLNSSEVPASAKNSAGERFINSDVPGTITVKDKSGAVIYDGSVNGVAAVIIAPGAPTKRSGVLQDRSVSNSDDPNDIVADTDPGIVTASRYLDLIGTQDNATLTHGDNDDGFILGPIGEKESSVTVNDQIVIVTTDEVIAAAEKAVLQAYTKALQEYHKTIWGTTVSNYRYPWLNAYNEITTIDNINASPNIYSVGNNRTGRVPFINLFEDHDSHELVADLQVDFDIDANLSDSNDGNDPAYLAAFLDGVISQTVTGSNYSFSKTAYAGAPNNKTDNVGMFVSQTSSPAITFTETLYFWDGCATTCADPLNGWDLCELPATSEQDCARSGGGFVPFTSWASHDDIKIRFVEITWTIDDEFRLGLNFANAPTYTNPIPPNLTDHASFIASIDSLITDLEIDVDGSVVDTHDFISAEVTRCEQDNFVGSNYNIPSSSPDVDSVYCMNNDVANTPPYNPAYDTWHDDAKEIVYPLAVSSAPTINQFDVHLDYFPQLPLWVSENNWNNSIMMAYSEAYEPGVTATCLLNNDDGTDDGNECLLLENHAGINNNIKSLLVLAGEHDFINDGAADLSDDLADIFEGENFTAPNLVFDKRQLAAGENSADHIMILDIL